LPCCGRPFCVTPPARLARTYRQRWMPTPRRQQLSYYAYHEGWRLAWAVTFLRLVLVSFFPAEVGARRGVPGLSKRNHAGFLRATQPSPETALARDQNRGIPSGSRQIAKSSSTKTRERKNDRRTAVFVLDPMKAPRLAQVLTEQLTVVRVQQSHLPVIPLHLDMPADPAWRCAVVADSTSTQPSKCTVRWLYW